MLISGEREGCSVITGQDKDVFERRQTFRPFPHDEFRDSLLKRFEMFCFHREVADIGRFGLIFRISASVTVVK